MTDTKRPRCQAIYTTAIGRGQCRDDSTELVNDPELGPLCLCWVHAKAHGNPTRTRPLMVVPLPKDPDSWDPGPSNILEDLQRAADLCREPPRKAMRVVSKTELDLMRGLLSKRNA